MGRHEEVSCQCEVRGWNACAHGRGERGALWARVDVRKRQEGAACPKICHYITSGKTRNTCHLRVCPFRVQVQYVSTMIYWLKLHQLVN